MLSLTRGLCSKWPMSSWDTSQCFWLFMFHLDGLEQNCGNPLVNALELQQSCSIALSPTHPHSLLDSLSVPIGELLSPPHSPVLLFQCLCVLIGNLLSRPTHLYFLLECLSVLIGKPLSPPNHPYFLLECLSVFIGELLPPHTHLHFLIERLPVLIGKLLSPPTHSYFLLECLSVLICEPLSPPFTRTFSLRACLFSLVSCCLPKLTPWVPVSSHWWTVISPNHPHSLLECLSVLIGDLLSPPHSPVLSP